MALSRIHRFVLVASLLACIAAALALPARAHALTLTTTARDVLDRADFRVSASSSDATGTALLMVDGKPITSALLTPGITVELGTFKFPVGSHTAVAVVRSRAGITQSEALPFTVWGLPGKAELITPQPGGYAAKYAACIIKPGLSTTLVHVYQNGKFLKTLAVSPGVLQNVGTLTLAAGVNTIDLVAANPMATTKTTYKVTRLDYPWPTCIIIDKSECNLYWIKNGVLVKVYRCAVGKPSTQTPVGTWKIGAKYITGPIGIYGPRKMRLYRQTSSGYVFTAYNIHGTNQEWVIGTWASHGCIRMYNKEILELYPQVPLGTMVQTRE